ncbi:hypothetical protein MAR_034204 [Mya arenaria]|uniref:von Hippel-Lindau disease tumour suppressor alpha domain-containing protein n=1 Tax=Mya arenaria TaxID=6604 RepID=A0ABY7GE92_MYAAR|nr:hypothetical protein MAR_034204 [Mya arenaria]
MCLIYPVECPIYPATCPIYPVTCRIYPVSAMEEGESSVREQVLKSQRSIHHSYIRFLNKTFRNVDVVWVNYQGDEMVVHLKEIFEPVAWNKEFDHWPPKRKVVYITIPVYSLQECCLQAIRSLVPRNGINDLDISDILKDDLHRIYRTKPDIQPRTAIT